MTSPAPVIAWLRIRRTSLRLPPARRIRTSIRAALESSRRRVADRVRQRALLRAQIFFDESVAERIFGACAAVVIAPVFPVGPGGSGGSGIVGSGVVVGSGSQADVLVVPVASARLDSLPAASIAVNPIV